MNRSIALAFLFPFLAVAAAATQPPEPGAPAKEHEFLQKFVGEWESESESTMAPGQPPTKCTGSIKGRMLGGYWLISEAQMDMPGVSVNALQTIGYDTDKKKYIGTWVDTMFNHLWKYEGSVNAAGTTLTLDAEGPDFAGTGKTMKYRDVYEFKSADHIFALSQMQGEDGKWITFMTGNCRRKK
jgi:hypothetical protein